VSSNSFCELATFASEQRNQPVCTNARTAGSRISTGKVPMELCNICQSGIDYPARSFSSSSSEEMLFLNPESISRSRQNGLKRNLKRKFLISSSKSCLGKKADRHGGRTVLGLDLARPLIFFSMMTSAGIFQHFAKSARKSFRSGRTGQSTQETEYPAKDQRVPFAMISH